MSSLGNQYQYLDPTAEEMDNGFVFSPVSLISSFLPFLWSLSLVHITGGL